MSNHHSILRDYYLVKDCEILYSGINLSRGTFYNCSCDPERKHMFCPACKDSCHSGIGHVVSKGIELLDVCWCGLKGHRKVNQAEIDLKYSMQCMFGEWITDCGFNKYFKFKEPIDEYQKICLFCKNVCFEKEDEKFIETSAVDENIPVRAFMCTCTHQNHREIGTMYKKFWSLGKEWKKYNLVGFTSLQFANIITRAKKSFDNIFHPFPEKISEIYDKLKNRRSKYNLEDLNIISNLHSSCKILSLFTKLFKNVYKLSDVYNKDINGKDVTIKGKTLMYLRKEVKELLANEGDNSTMKHDVYFTFMMTTFNSKMINIWKLKKYLTNLYYAFVIGMDFARYPNFKNKDLMLLSPIQRLTILSNIKKENENEINEYLYELNGNILHQILELLTHITQSNEDIKEVYSIYHKLCKICQLFAKFNLFNFKQAVEFSQICETIIFAMAESLSLQKSLENIMLHRLKFKVISAIAKSLSYLAYNYNDLVIESYYRKEDFKEETMNKLNFFHKKSEVCKLLTKMSANCLTYVRHFSQLYHFHKYKRNIEVFDYFINPLTKNCIKNTVQYSNEILNLILGVPDNYVPGLTRSISKNYQLSLEYYLDNMNERELDFVQKMRKYFNDLENEYFLAFDNYDNTYGKLIEKLKIIFTSIVIECKNHNYEKSILLEEDSILDNEDKRDNEKVPISSNIKIPKNNPNVTRNNEGNIKEYTKYQLLLNKTYLIPSAFKSIQILFALSNPFNSNSEFIIDEELFLQISYLGLFFIQNNLDNSIFFMISDITTSIELLNDNQLLQMLSLIECALRNILATSDEITINSNIMHLLKVVCSKTLKDLESLLIVLKIMKHVIKINFGNEQSTERKLKKIIMFKLFPQFKKFGIKFIDVVNFNDIQRKIIKYFFQIVIKIFEGNSILEGRSFLESIIQKNEIQTILSNHALDISIRTVLLVFYRIVYIDIVMGFEYVNYISLMRNEPNIKKNTEESIENQKSFRFYQKLILNAGPGKGDELSKIGDMEEIGEIIKDELKYYTKVLDANNEILTNKKKRNYIEYGIILTFFVYYSKYSCLYFEIDKYNDFFTEYLKLFLEIKKYIYTNKREYFKKDNQNVKSNDKNPFQNPLCSWGYGKEYIINDNLNDDILSDIDKDLNKEYNSFTQLNKTFQEHFNDFIKIKNIEDMKDFFEKRQEMFTEEKLNSMRKSDEETSEFEKENFNLIIKYINDKNSLEKSSFLKALEENNAKYNCKQRVIVVKNILFFMKNYNFERKYKEQCLWQLFRILQYDTVNTQELCFDLLNQKNKSLNFEYLVQNFTFNLMSILVRNLNPCVKMIKHDYFLALMLIKILKYFCEEHNQNFQRIFFIKEQGGLVLHFSIDQIEFNEEYIQKTKISLISESNHGEDELKDLNELNELKDKRLTKPNPDIEPENFHEITRSEERNREIQENKMSVFEYMMSILSKIVQLSKWTSNEKENAENYFYDLYFVILEFLIETIQGTRTENLQSIFTDFDKGIFGRFLLEMNQFMIQEDGTEFSYTVRKDMMEFLMAFFEEIATPTSGIKKITSVISPISVLDTIISIMNQLYIEQGGMDKINKKKNKKRKKDKEKESENLYQFTPQMKKFFTDLYFNDPDFPNNDKFQLANRMFQYFKLNAIEESYRNQLASEFFDKIAQFSESKIIRMYGSKKFIIENDNKKNFVITDSRFFDNYLCAAFFESITRTVFVNHPSRHKEVRVLFTLNPKNACLSKISKDEFLETVDRSNRIQKLSALLENCEYFKEEVNYKTRNRGNIILKIIFEINFYWFEVISFIISFALLLSMFYVYRGTGDQLLGKDKYSFIRNIGLFCLVYNCFCLICWMFSKFNIFYQSQKQKDLQEKKKKLRMFNNDIDEEKVELSLREEINVFLIVFFVKKQLIIFQWNIILSLIAIFTKEVFLYTLQLLNIIVLSATIKNMFSSLNRHLRQLGALLTIVIILNYLFGMIGFVEFSIDYRREVISKETKYYPEDFEFLIPAIGVPYNEPGHIENLCGSLLYCFITHLDFGMRFDGGMADNMAKASYTYNPNYFVGRFFYEFAYFIFLVILLLNYIFGVVIGAYFEYKNKMRQIKKDKTEVCFICGINKEACENAGEKIETHFKKVHNIGTYIEYIINLSYVDKQESNAVNSYVIESLETRELTWFPNNETNSEDQ